MNILFYNWTPARMEEGGGVSVYMDNLISYLRNCNEKLNSGKVLCLSSGYYYDNKQKTYVKELEPYHGFKSFTIVNSPCFAPHTGPAQMYRAMVYNEEICDLFGKFLCQYGPFDIVHFHSLEGLSPSVFSLKKQYPSTRFVFTLHDYGLFCSNVKLWRNDGVNCYLQKERNCGACMQEYMRFSLREKIGIRIRDITGQKKTLLEKLWTRMRLFLLSLMLPFLKRRRMMKYNQSLNDYRQSAIRCINDYCDCVIAVSRRVAQIAMDFGVRGDLLHVDYIGTKVAENQMKCKMSMSTDNRPFTILFMGYFSKVKGAYMLLDTLERIPLNESRGIRLIFASRINDEVVFNRVECLRDKYADVIIKNGYTHEDFPVLFANVDLGIVPPLWEDNLPQVTIEMIANGVPALTSCYGGAHELNSHPLFSFKSEQDLLDKIVQIKNDKQILHDYWEYSSPLTTMEMHVSNLFYLYIIS